MRLSTIKLKNQLLSTLYLPIPTQFRNQVTIKARQYLLTKINTAISADKNQ